MFVFTDINDLHLQDEALAAHLVHPKLMRALTEVLGPNVDCWQCATVIKPPGQTAAGGGYGWHQDIADYGGSGDTDGSASSYQYLLREEDIYIDLLNSHFLT